MADIKRDDHPAMIPGYGQPPEGVRTDHPELPDQQWGANTEGKPTEQKGSEGQNVDGPEVPETRRYSDEATEQPRRTPVQGP